MAGALETVSTPALRMRDVPRALLAPRGVFGRVEDIAQWGWPLIVLLAGAALVGFFAVQTGLIDRQVDRMVQERIADIDRDQRDVVDRSKLREMYAEQLKAGEYQKVMARIQVIIAQPVSILASVLIIASVLYGAVALTGRKAEWNTLLNICVVAGFVELLKHVAELAMMFSFATLRVDTSLAVAMQWIEPARLGGVKSAAAIGGALTALDPFRLWFWGVVLTGLSATGQLRGWRAWLVCGGCWLAAAGVRAGLATASVAGGP